MTVKQRLDGFDTKLDDIKDSLGDIKITLAKYDVILNGTNNDGLIKEFKDVKKTVNIHSRNFWGLGILSCIFGTIVGFIVNIIANRHF